MSLNAMEWVWEHSTARGVARLVLLAIADRATGDTCTAYAGTAMLVRRTGAARSSVRDAVDRLLTSGELAVLNGARGPRGETRYSLPHAAHQLRTMPTSDAPEAPVAGGPSTGPDRESAPRSPALGMPTTGPEGADHRPGRGPATGPPNQREHNHQQTSSADARANPPTPETAVPDLARPLLTALNDAGVTVAWRLDPGEWATVLAAVNRWGIDHLVQVAIQRTTGRDVRSARYLLAIWRDPANLTTPAASTTPHQPHTLGAAVIPLHSARPSTTDQRVSDGMALAARLRAQEGAT